MPDRYIPPLSLENGDRPSASTLRQWVRNARWLYHTLHMWPSRARNVQGFGTSRNMEPELAVDPAKASTFGFFDYPFPNDKYPVRWHAARQCAIRKTGRRNTLKLKHRFRSYGGSQVFRTRTFVNGTQVYFRDTISGTQNWEVDIDLAPLGIAPGAIYRVYNDIERISGTRIPFRYAVDSIEGYENSGVPPPGFPTLPTFTGDTNLSDADLDALTTAMAWLFERVLEHTRPGLAGYLELDRTGFDRDRDGWATLRNFTLRRAATRFNVVLQGRLSPIGNQRLRLKINNTAFGEAQFNGPEAFDPWVFDVDASSAISGLAVGAEFPVDLEYYRTNATRPSVPTRFSINNLEARQTTVPSIGTHPPIFAGVPYDPRPVLQWLSDTLQAARTAYGNAAVLVDRDLPFDWQWDAAAAWDRHNRADNPDVGKDLDPERQGDKRRFPAAFVRWGDVLEVCGRNVVLHWGPFTPDEKEPRNLAFAYSKNLTEGDREITTRVFLDAVTADGARLPAGQTYYITADRLIYAGERVYEG